MITPQDIREKTFEKAVFGGYDMGSVDSFLEDISGALEMLQKENAVLKGKMKVLVDKIEDYRSNEDALRTAILSAQKLGNMIEQEARDKSDAMLTQAVAEAGRVTKEATCEVEVEKARLDEAKRSSIKFIDSMELLCNKQLSFLKKLNEADFVKAARSAESAPAAAPVRASDSNEIHETVKSIEETVAKVASEPVQDIRPDIAPSGPAEDVAPTRAFNVVSDADDDIEKTTQFSFDGFSFGE